MKMEKIIAKLSGIKDTRHSGYIKYKLADVLSIILCVVLCGLDEVNELIEETEQIIKPIDIVFSSELKSYINRLGVKFGGFSIINDVQVMITEILDGIKTKDKGLLFALFRNINVLSR